MEDDETEPLVHGGLDSGDHGGPAPSPAVSGSMEICFLGECEDPAEEQHLAAGERGRGDEPERYVLMAARPEDGLHEQFHETERDAEPEFSHFGRTADARP
jgi:hypothetical protein